MKDELVKFLQELYKPKSQFEQERVEYNQINILAEYFQFNMIFAKNELMFDNYKTAVVVQMFWNLLEFDPEEEAQKKEEAAKSSAANSPDIAERQEAPAAADEKKDEDK